jgi:hypothetical protein
MKRVLTLLFILASCSSVNIPMETYEFVNINDLVTSDTMQTCVWNYNGDEQISTYPTNGSFMSTGTAYYFVNTVEGDLTGITTKHALYDGTNIYLWNDQTVQPIGQTLTSENYMDAIYNNTIGYAAYLDMMNHIDYGITCTDSVGTLPELPELNWLTI